MSEVSPIQASVYEWEVKAYRLECGGCFTEHIFLAQDKLKNWHWQCPQCKKFHAVTYPGQELIRSGIG